MVRSLTRRRPGAMLRSLLGGGCSLWNPDNGADGSICFNRERGQAKRLCLLDCLAAPRDLQLLVEVERVAFDGARGDAQLLRDLLVGQAARQQAEDVELAICQQVEAWA
jgi:hypothetical protein